MQLRIRRSAYSSQCRLTSRLTGGLGRGVGPLSGVRGRVGPVGWGRSRVSPVGGFGGRLVPAGGSHCGSCRPNIAPLSRHIRRLLARTASRLLGWVVGMRCGCAGRSGIDDRLRRPMPDIRRSGLASRLGSARNSRGRSGRGSSGSFGWLTSGVRDGRARWLTSGVRDGRGRGFGSRCSRGLSSWSGSWSGGRSGSGNGSG